MSSKKRSEEAERLKINLCDTCEQHSSIPECMPDGDDIEFGTGMGNDNICRCVNYIGETV